MRLPLRAILLPLLVSLAACSAEDAEALPPNLLFVSIDTLRADALGSYGSEAGASPFLDELAERSLRFGSAWAHTPKTAPSHMTMFTGLPPRAHGLGNQRSSGNQSLSESVATLAEVLSTAGYRTGAVTSGGNIKGYLGFDRGFDSFNEKPSQPDAKLKAMGKWIRSAADTTLTGERPWFALFHTYAVHDPYLPPKKFRKRFTDSAYDGEILGDPAELTQSILAGEDLAPWAEGHAKACENFWARVDEGDPDDLAHLHQLYMAGVAGLDHVLGGFLKRLEADGLLENTIVVITSDHGEEFGEHGDTRHNSVWREHLHVPLIVLLPDTGDFADLSERLKRGRVIDAPVRHMDLMPSLLELMGLEPDELVPHTMLGESWASWIHEPDSVDTGRPVYGEHRSKLDQPLDMWALRADGHLLIQPEPGAEPVLVDLDENALERVDGESIPGSLDPADPRYAELLDLQRRLLGSFQKEAEQIGAGPGVELDPAARAELEALGYL